MDRTNLLIKSITVLLPVYLNALTTRADHFTVNNFSERNDKNTKSMNFDRSNNSEYLSGNSQPTFLVAGDGNHSDLRTSRSIGYGGLGLFRLISFNNYHCQGNKLKYMKAREMPNGVCYSKRKCAMEGGSVIGICAQGFGVCCAISQQCTKEAASISVRNNKTVLSNSDDYQGPCKIEFPKRSGVCRLHIEFEETYLSDADITGFCSSESIVITGSVTVRDKFTFCGNITGQHLRLSYGDSSKIILHVLRRFSTSMYKLRVTQIRCQSSDQGSDNYCLQKFQSGSGIVKSFGYPIQQQNNQKYSICIEPEYIKSKIKWTPCKKAGMMGGKDPFFISGTAPTNGLISGHKCTGRDYISIYGKNKYCGGQFWEIKSKAKPFYLFVHFDDTELPQISKYPYVGENACSLSESTQKALGIQCDTSNGNVCQCTRTEDQVDGSSTTELSMNLDDVENTGFCLKYTTLV